MVEEDGMKFDGIQVCGAIVTVLYIGTIVWLYTILKTFSLTESELVSQVETVQFILIKEKTINVAYRSDTSTISSAGKGAGSADLYR